jgi:hypothetical protein
MCETGTGQQVAQLLDIYMIFLNDTPAVPIQQYLHYFLSCNWQHIVLL